jgi:hypothetical protein
MLIRHAGFVSCDLIGYSRSDHQTQVAQVEAINRIVRARLVAAGSSDMFWASRGDGGHVVITTPNWIPPLVGLIGDLFAWATAEGAGLRITAHYGETALVEGADDRVEMAGDGINFAAAILEHGTTGRVVVSEAVRAALTSASLPNVHCHDTRTLPLKHFPPAQLSLLSVEGSFRSQWSDAGHPGLQRLAEARQKNAAWDILYYAKRLMQANASDPAAAQAMGAISSLDLTYLDDEGNKQLNPLLGKMDEPTRANFVLDAELVERGPGELLCQQRDPGDTMFVILRGEIGIFTQTPTEAGGDPYGNFVRIRRAGEIVGELAVLNHERTATMRALSPTALLAVRRKVTSDAALTEFFRRRVLEHVSRNASYLVGPSARPGPLAGLSGYDKPWERMTRFADLFPRDWQTAPPIAPGDEQFRRPGLYVLVSGSVRNADNPEHSLDATRFPLLLVDCPGEFVYANHTWALTSDVWVLHIGLDAIKQFGARAFSNIVSELKYEAAQQYYYDAFLAYSGADLGLARRWKDLMEQQGLKVFLDDATQKVHNFAPALVAALRNALVLVPLISANAHKKKPKEVNWILREIEMRKDFYGAPRANILPIELTGGKVDQIASGYSPISAVTRGEEAALGEAITFIRQVRAGKIDPPFTTARA